MGLLARTSQEHYVIDYVNSTGVGFYGSAGFGYSIAVNDYNSRTYLTNSNGTIEGPETANNKWVNATGVCYGVAGEDHPLTELPQNKSTLNISFYNDSVISVQNAEMRAYDGSNVSNAPSGMNVYLAEIINPNQAYVNSGSGDVYWTNASGSTGILTLSDSPGSSALWAFSGGTSTSTFHDWYIAISVKPTSVGSKTGNKLYITLEYL